MSKCIIPPLGAASVSQGGLTIRYVIVQRHTSQRGMPNGNMFLQTSQVAAGGTSTVASLSQRPAMKGSTFGTIGPRSTNMVREAHQNHA